MLKGKEACFVAALLGNYDCGSARTILFKRSQVRFGRFRIANRSLTGSKMRLRWHLALSNKIDVQSVLARKADPRKVIFCKGFKWLRMLDSNQRPAD